MVPVAVRLWVMVLGAGVESCTSIPIEEKMMGVQK